MDNMFKIMITLTVCKSETLQTDHELVSLFVHYSVQSTITKHANVVSSILCYLSPSVLDCNGIKGKGMS